MIRTVFLFLIVAISLNAWADSIAESQMAARSRYRGFIEKLKEDAAKDKLNLLEVDRIKEERARSLELSERARREYILQREARRKQELSSEMRDQVLEEQLSKEKKSYEEAEKFFLRQRELIKNALKAAPQVDPHDEYEVGKHYEDDSGEVEEDSTE